MIAWWLVPIAIFVALLIIVTRRLADDDPRCPNCGAIRPARPHKPNCRYWRD